MAEAKYRWLVDISDMRLRVSLNGQPMPVSRVAVDRTLLKVTVLTIEIQVTDEGQHELQLISDSGTLTYSIDAVSSGDAEGTIQELMCEAHDDQET